MPKAYRGVLKARISKLYGGEDRDWETLLVGLSY